MSDAENKVFGTFELVENILLFVPHRDLLVSAQRVCKYWNTIIRTSIYIQQKLFYKQTKPSSKSVSDGPVINPFLAEILRLGHAVTSGYGWGYKETLLFIDPSGTPPRGYRKLPKKLRKMFQSWMAMYPTSEPVTVDIFGSEESWLEGQQTTLGSIMAVVNNTAVPGRTEIVKHWITARLLPCHVLIHDRMVKLSGVQQEIRWAVKARTMTLLRPTRRLERDPLWVS